MIDPKPFQRSCEKNKEPLLAVLRAELSASSRLLEIGSGTGQHAVFFAPRLSHLLWQCSDVAANHPGINAWIDDFPSQNLLRPIEVSVPDRMWRLGDFDAFFTAITAQIMSRDEVKSMMENVSASLPEGGVFCQYGPFAQRGEFSTPSNEAFHNSLIERGYGGYRDTEELMEWAPALVLKRIVAMPTNNLTLVWRKQIDC